jgi:phage baseplate assembly protein W
MRPLSFPYRIDQTGRTAVVEPEREIRELIEQLLFVAPGERVMRPTLGSGVAQLVFAPASEQVAATAQHLVQGALQTWLGDRLSIDDVDVMAEEAVLTVTIRYRVRLTGEAATAVLTGEV